MKIGFHLSMAKGFDHVLHEARRLGCEAVQVFVKNPRSWAGKEVTEEMVAAAGRLMSFCPVFAHLSYLPNLARIDEDGRHMEGLLHEAALCRDLGIRSLVVHCGSRPDRGKGAEMVARAVDRVQERFEVEILLENSAGEGNEIGSTMQELAMIYGQTRRKDLVGLCLDTAHLHQAGYDISGEKGWNALIREVERTFGKDKIRLFHLNDSKTAPSSRKDRHWHIGLGTVGLESFRYVVNNKKFARLCGVMETPKADKWDEENMRTMRSLSSSLVSRPSS